LNFRPQVLQLITVDSFLQNRIIESLRHELDFYFKDKNIFGRRSGWHTSIEWMLLAIYDKKDVLLCWRATLQQCSIWIESACVTKRIIVLRSNRVRLWKNCCSQAVSNQQHKCFVNKKTHSKVLSKSVKKLVVFIKPLSCVCNTIPYWNDLFFSGNVWVIYRRSINWANSMYYAKDTIILMIHIFWPDHVG
jgi:hypothetical protein